MSAHNVGIESLLQDLGDFAGNEAAQELYLRLRLATEGELSGLKEIFGILLRYETRVDGDKLLGVN